MIRLTNGQWERIRNHFPEEHIPDGRPGRKPIPTRRVFEAVLWILNTGAQWHMLPQSYPNYKSVHRRFQTWCRDELAIAPTIAIHSMRSCVRTASR
jgi:transposase